MPRQSTKVPRVCVTCDRPFLARADQVRAGGGKFCGRSCRTMAQNNARPSLSCAKCNTIFRVNPARIGEAKYCSTACQQQGRLKPRSVVDVDETNGTARVTLYSKGGAGATYAVIDVSDAVWAGQYRWSRTGPYAARATWDGTRRHTFFMHRELLGLVPGDGLEGDHIDRDKLNNRRSNLRVLADGNNSQNVPSQTGSSVYRGVSWNKTLGKWEAFVCPDGRKRHLGVFVDEAEAAEVARLARSNLMPFSTD